MKNEVRAKYGSGTVTDIKNIEDNGKIFRVCRKGK